jgi:hypothetical protein
VYGKKETDLGQAESGMSLLQQAKAETSGQNGKDGVSEGINTVSGGKVGSDNVGNNDNSFNGNGGNGGHVSCLETCFARGGSGGDHNSGNHGNSDNGNGGNAGDIRRCGLEFCTAGGGKGGSSNSKQFIFK